MNGKKGVLAQKYDDLPEITEADMRRGVWKIAGHVVNESEGRAAFGKMLRQKTKEAHAGLIRFS